MPDAVLFVDDDAKVLNALRRTFMAADYSTFFAGNGKEALIVLEKEKIDLVVSDMRMPEMDGYELLAEVKKRWPSVIRTMLSGYAEKETILKAITDGTAKAYFSKPWDNTDLKKQLAHLFTMRDSMNTIGVLEAINRIDQLPALPALYCKVLGMIQAEENIMDIAKVIEREPGWVANILKVVNSAFYGHAIASVHQALTFLGMVTVKQIILSSELFESVNGCGLGDWHVDAIWEHSNACNKILQALYQTAHQKKIPEDFSMAGVLHDIGKLLILKYYLPQLNKIIETQIAHPGWSRQYAEKQILGVSHAELGAYLLDWWNLPQPLIESCLYHHDPLNEKVLHRDVIALLQIADYYAWKVLDKEPRFEIPSEVFDAAGISRTDTVKTLENRSESWAI